MPTGNGEVIVAVPPYIAVVIVPPSIGISVLNDAKKAGVKRLWFQPGAESPAIVAHAKQIGLRIVASGACIMVVRRQCNI
ncbi:MAG: CoA-binding protein [Candidatus Kerfeldbacteria bacterium]